MQYFKIKKAIKQKKIEVSNWLLNYKSNLWKLQNSDFQILKNHNSDFVENIDIETPNKLQK